ncbi:MAG: hypothetical protein RI897_3266 [Verrucomicrobiota bacterium]
MVGGGEFGVGFYCGVEGAGAKAIEDGFAEVFPVIGIFCGVEWGDDDGVGHLGGGFEAAEEIDGCGEGFLVVVLAGLACLEGGEASGEGSLERGDFCGGVVHTFGFDAVFEALVEVESAPEFEGLPFEGRAFGAFLGIGGPGFIFQGVHGGEDLVEGVVFSVFAGIGVGLWEAEEGDEFRVVDAEDLSGIGGGGFEEDFEQPIDGGDSLATTLGVKDTEMEFDGGFLFTAELEERIPGDGVHGLDAAVEEDGESAEVLAMDAGLGFGEEGGKGPGGHEDGQAPGPPVEFGFRLHWTFFGGI